MQIVLSKIVTVFLLILLLGIPTAAQGVLRPLGHIGSISSKQGSATALEDTYEYTYLRIAIGLWADGKGDTVIENIIKNNADTPLDNLSWCFNWRTDDYSAIHAADDLGPLRHDDTNDQGSECVKVIFRKGLAKDQSYHFKLWITIGGMASGSGSDWSANWYFTPGANARTFEEEVSFPANATLTSISPTPTGQSGNTPIWSFDNVAADYRFDIAVSYTLSFQISNVSLLLQTDAPWNDDLYAFNTEKVDNMARWGCLTTSGAMLINYWASSQGKTFQTNPGFLNEWLRANQGYTVNNGVKHAWIGKYARKNGLIMYWNQTLGRNDSKLDLYLQSGYPVILGVNPTTCDNGQICPGHYVVATGKTQVDGVDTYTIADPTYGNTNLKQKWSNQYLTMIAFSASDADARTFSFIAESPVDFVVTDPMGRKSGYDPTTQVSLNDIPLTNYVSQAIVPVDGSSGQINWLEMDVKSPLAGDYQTTVYGVAAGNYTLEVAMLDWKFDDRRTLYAGVATTGSVDMYTTAYVSELSSIYLPSIMR